MVQLSDQVAIVVCGGHDLSSGRDFMECKVRDTNMHYEEISTGKPLLILHGAAQGNGRMAMSAFEPVFEAHSGWRRIYPDLPGHGKTPAPEWLREHDDVLDLVLEFMDIVAPGERFVVVG